MEEKISSFLQTDNNFKEGLNKTKSSLEFLASSHTPAWCGAEQSLEFVFICNTGDSCADLWAFPDCVSAGHLFPYLWYQFSNSNISWLPSNPIHRLKGSVQQDCPIANTSHKSLAPGWLHDMSTNSRISTLSPWIQTAQDLRRCYIWCFLIKGYIII